MLYTTFHGLTETTLTLGRSKDEINWRHQSGAALWGIRGYSGGVIHVTVSRKSTSTKRIRRHLSHMPPDERTAKEGVPATSVHRTIFDLARGTSASP